MTESELVAQYEPMIRMFAKKIKNHNSSDVCMEICDVIQLGRIHVMHAIRKYSPDKGAKLSTFIYLVLGSKFKNLVRDIRTANKRGTLHMSSIRKRYDNDSDSQDSSDDFAEPSSEETLHRLLDAARSFESHLTSFEKTIFNAFFLEGGNQSIDDIVNRYPDVSSGKVKETIKELTKLFSTEGFNELRSKDRIGKGWFDSSFIEGNAARGTPVRRSSRGSKNVTRRKGIGHPRLSFKEAHETRHRAEHQQLQFRL